MRKTIKHKVHTITEKNEIVKEYLSGTTGFAKINRKYDISGRQTLYNWVKQYKQFGTTTDNRGKSSKKGISGRKKQLNPEQMSREELIEYVKAVEDIKKLVVYLNKQKKNIK